MSGLVGSLDSFILMRKINDRLVYSPSDLINFIESPFASWMDRAMIEGMEGVCPDQEDEERQLVAEEGNRHEENFLQSLLSEGANICKIDPIGKSPVEETRAAILRKEEVIYQATLGLNEFRGNADFLFFNAEENHYEVWDTKLARKSKPYFMVQLCCYSEMLSHIQGVLPKRMGIVLGNDKRDEYLLDDFFDYYQRIKTEFLSMMNGWNETNRPEPVASAEHGRWSGTVEAWVQETDHLSQVAEIRTAQIEKLRDAGIDTLKKLATYTGAPPQGMAEKVFLNLRQQAKLQQMTKDKKLGMPSEEEVVPPVYIAREKDETSQEPRGLELLPPFNSQDIFFDLEGFPLSKEGLEYLWGASFLDDSGNLDFKDWWAHDEKEEKQALVDFVEWAYRRWLAHPGLRIYHYGHYEIARLKNLSGRYGVCENQVDDMLRNYLFVDLYKVVKQGLVVGSPSYSIKEIEKLYDERKDDGVSTSMGSVVAYAKWKESGEPKDPQNSPILNEIREYNKFDCDSTKGLADWLRERQEEYGVRYVPLRNDADGEDEISDRELLDLEVSALEKVIFQVAEQTDSKVWEIMGHLLRFHERERKPVWWKLFDWNSKTIEELVDDKDCLGGAVLVGAPQQVKKSFVYQYRFDSSQDTSLLEGKRGKVVGNLGLSVGVEQLTKTGSLMVKVSQQALQKNGAAHLPSVLSLMPYENFFEKEIKESIFTVCQRLVDTQLLPNALNDFLHRQPPNVSGVNSGSVLLPEKGDKVEECKRLVEQMNSTCLCIQGPPGAGKTYLASHLIVHLLEKGANVGITSNSHKAILNILSACNERMNGAFECIKAGGSREDEFFAKCKGAFHRKDSSTAIKAYERGAIGGTAWLFSRKEMVGELDYLFIDEAGQVSVANLVAMSRSAKNIVLIGDQMQLEQPIQASHPKGSGQSTLEYFLGEQQTIPPHLGIFLDTTWRMHPEVCRFVSQSFYEGRLKARHENENQKLILSGHAREILKADSGISFIPVEHVGNTQSSSEEGEAIQTLTQLLVGQKYSDKNSKIQKLKPSDILVVTPYNAQVRLLESMLGDQISVGTVDKFQGQEAIVVIVSLCLSKGEVGPRGVDFVLDMHRINVAVSRAKTLAIVVGDPGIADADMTSIHMMKCLNLMCRIRKFV